ncbi:hypothetical protein ACVW2B_003651 [Ewingella americana]
MTSMRRRLLVMLALILFVTPAHQRVLAVA